MALLCLCSFVGRAETPEQSETYRRAVSMMETGQFAAARDIFMEVLARRRAEFGAWHPETVSAQLYLGQAYTALGRPREGLDLMGPLVAHWKKTFGPDEPVRLIGLASFGVALREAGQHEEALKILSDVAARLRRVTPNESQRLPRVLNELCTTLAYCRRMKEAIQTCHESLAIMERAQGEVHPIHIASIQTTLGQALLLSNRPDEALEWTAKAREIYRRFDYEHPELATLDAAAGTIHLLRGRLTSAETYLRSALDRFRRVLGTDHPEVAAVMERLAETMRRQKRKEEARQLGEEARAIQRRAEAASPVSVWSLRPQQ